MAQISYKSNVGSVILRLLNGLKHTPQTIGPLLGIAPEELEKIIKGEADLTFEIEKKLVSVRGINQWDFYPAEVQHLFPVFDDTDDGVVICRREDTIKSQRTISRGPDQVPYYIYGDMAMSNLSAIKPEWIKQLYVNDGENANDLPDWAFNKGHFEHQMTYFIGQVNFHWKGKDGKKHVCQMNTGDTNYIVPFVPHSFTTRKEGEGVILAVTYEGAIAEPNFQSHIATLSMEKYLEMIRSHLSSCLDHLFIGLQNGVIISRYSKAIFMRWGSPAPFELIGLGIDTGIFELNLKKKYLDLTARFDIWGYNPSSIKIMFAWNGGCCVLDEGDSFLIRKGISYICAGMEPGGKLLCFQTGQLCWPFDELALIEKYIGEEGLRRVHTETTRWY